MFIYLAIFIIIITIISAIFIIHLPFLSNHQSIREIRTLFCIKASAVEDKPGDFEVHTII